MVIYKGYTGKVEYDNEAGCFYGEIIGLHDVITFKGTSVNELQKSFKESIDDYLAFCERMGKAPDTDNSPFDNVTKVKLGITTQEIVKIIRECREGISN